MKKNDLLKSIGICFFVFIILSWIIPTGSYSSGEYIKGVTSPVGLTDLFYYPVVTFGTFIQYGILFLCLGGFYGVINKTGVYKKWIDAIVKRFKGKEKRFLILTIILLSVVSALTGTTLALFTVVPLLIAVIMSLGYNKLVALASTIGAIMVGNIGSLYGMNIGHINASLNLSASNNIIAKIVLLVVLVFLLIMYVLKKEVKGDSKKEEIPLLEKETKSEKSYVPLVVIIAFITLLLIVSMYSWNYILGIKFFEDVYQSLMNIKIGEYTIMKNLIGDISPFGYWDTYEMSFTLLAASLLTGWIYSLKVSDMITSFAEGTKKMFKVAFYVVLSNIIFALMLSVSGSSILNTINYKILSASNKFNIINGTILPLVGALFYNNFYYLVSTTMTAAQSVYTDTNVYGVFGLLFQSIYSLVMLIIPTSFVLIAGLSMLNISLKDWFKYIWKYLIQVFAIILIVSIIVFIII